MLFRKVLYGNYLAGLAKSSAHITDSGRKIRYFYLPVLWHNCRHGTFPFGWLLMQCVTFMLIQIVWWIWFSRLKCNLFTDVFVIEICITSVWSVASCPSDSRRRWTLAVLLAVLVVCLGMFGLYLLQGTLKRVYLTHTQMHLTRATQAFLKDTL